MISSFGRQAKSGGNECFTVAWVCWNCGDHSGLFAGKPRSYRFPAIHVGARLAREAISRTNELPTDGLKFRCPLSQDAPYVKSLLALLSLVALPVLAAEPTLYGRYEYLSLIHI